jgi:hypothetical protein
MDDRLNINIWFRYAYYIKMKRATNLLRIVVIIYTLHQFLMVLPITPNKHKLINYKIIVIVAAMRHLKK